MSVQAKFFSVVLLALSAAFFILRSVNPKRLAAIVAVRVWARRVAAALIAVLVLMSAGVVYAILRRPSLVGALWLNRSEERWLYAFAGIGVATVGCGILFLRRSHRTPSTADTRLISWIGISIVVVSCCSIAWTQYLRTPPAAMFHADSARTGVFTARGPRAVPNARVLVESRNGVQLASDQAIVSSPVVADGVAYYGRLSGEVAARPTGDEAGRHGWSIVLHGAVVSSPALYDRMLYVGCDDHALYALAAVDGRERWRFPTGGAVRSSPALFNRVVYVGSDDGFLYAVGAETGKQLWRIELGSALRSSPAIRNGRVYVVGADGVAHAVDLRTHLEVGHAATRRAVGDPDDLIAPSVVATDDRVYVVDPNGTLNEYDALLDDASHKQIAVGAGVRATPAVDGETVWVATMDGRLKSFLFGGGDIQVGQSFDTGTGLPIRSSPLIAGDEVYVGSDDGWLYAFPSGETGRAWSFGVGSPIRATPTFANGALYVGSLAGQLVKLWGVAPEGSPTSLPTRTASSPTATAIGGADPTPPPTSTPTAMPTATVTATAVAPPTAASAGPPPVMFRGNASRDGSQPGPGPAAKPDRLWVVPVWNPASTLTKTTEGSWSSPIVANGAVFLGGTDGYVHAFDAATGDARWSARTQAIVQSSPAVADGVVYVGGEDGQVYAIDAANGSPRWTYRASQGFWASPAVAGGTVFAATKGGSLLALDAATGALRWNVETGASTFASPAVANGIVYLAGTGDTATLAAYDAGTGAELWTFGLTPTAVVYATPLVADGTVYVATLLGQLCAVDAGSGQQRWCIGLGQGIWSSPALVGQSLYFGTDAREIQAVDARTGDQLWTAHAGDKVNSSPAVVDGVVYVGSDDGILYALDAMDGAARWSVKTGGIIAASAAVAGGVVYVSSWDGFLYAFGDR